MKKQTQREKIVVVQEKRLEAVKGGSGYIIATGDEGGGDPDQPVNGGG